ncbi:MULTISPECIES: hypothetical protein [Nocardia]|uniref:hypothetical protein n=1 Tax=Nocardia TaxID=1817 RepID=UPI00245479E3|nr:MULTISPECIES: hypothetical protein [Nocardia]
MTTYAAHIIDADAQALGDPEITIMTQADEAGAADYIASYPLLPGGKAPEILLAEEGWRVTGEPTYVETGYYIVDVETVDVLRIVEHVTYAKDVADAEAQRQATAFRTVIGDAMRDGASGPKVAKAANLSPERVYQIRDGRR